MAVGRRKVASGRVVNIFVNRSFLRCGSFELLRDGNNIAYTGPETRVTAANTNYCATTYQVRACNAGGCSPWSTSPMTQVLEIRDGV